jgi:hypothetical protein
VVVVELILLNAFIFIVIILLLVCLVIVHLLYVYASAMFEWKCCRFFF